MEGVCSELERCRTPDDQEVIERLVKKLLAKLPADFVKLEHEKTLKANDLCRVRVIRRLTDAKLGALGIIMGDAMMLLDVLHAETAPSNLGVPAEHAPMRAPRRPEMRPFPNCRPTRYPDLGAGSRTRRAWDFMRCRR